MAVFTSVRFSGKIDSKGRVTVPSRIRDKLGLDLGDKISVEVNSIKVIRKECSTEEDALSYLSGLENVRSFNFNGEILEVIVDE